MSTQTSSPSSHSSRFGPLAGTALAATALVWATRAQAHGISEESKETMTAGGIPEYIWLGAEHMVTGYDHLLFLFGVIFFLSGFKDIVRFITAFTLGHCITLLGATLAGITANAYVIDAVIALSVIYKGFENLDGFKKTFGIQAPNLLGMVFLFGLIHGFGLSTRLQELPLGDSGIVGRILAFNVGVELGQIAALTLMLGVFAAWRSTKTFERFGKIANIGLILAGLGLFVLQIDGYLHEDHHADEHADDGADHDAHGHDHDQAGGDHHAPVVVPAAKAKSSTKAKKVEKAGKKAHSHTHGKKAKKAKKRRHTHRHGSGKPHSH